jgi:hypothetical protein
MQPECVTKGACCLPSFFHRSTPVRTKCKRKGQTGRGTSFRQAVTEHAYGHARRTPCLDQTSTAAMSAPCWRSEGHVTD